jgi:tetratricopeptide (TPR) repeat protein
MQLSNNYIAISVFLVFLVFGVASGQYMNVATLGRLMKNEDLSNRDKASLFNRIHELFSIINLPLIILAFCYSIAFVNIEISSKQYGIYYIPLSLLFGYFATTRLGWLLATSYAFLIVAFVEVFKMVVSSNEYFYLATILFASILCQIVWEIRKAILFKNELPSMIVKLVDTVQSFELYSKKTKAPLDHLGSLISQRHANKNKDFAYVKARYFHKHEKYQDVVDLIGGFSSNTRDDQLLVSAYVHLEQFDKAKARLENLSVESAVELLEKIPGKGKTKICLLVFFLSKQKRWADIEERVNDQDKLEILSFLELLPSSSGRDSLITKILYKLSKYSDIVKLTSKYSLDEGRELLERNIPDEFPKYEILIRFCDNHSQYNDVRKYTHKMSSKQDAVDLIATFTPREEYEVIIIELLYLDNDTSYLQKYIAKKERLLKILQGISPSLIRDRHIVKLLKSKKDYAGIISILVQYRNSEEIETSDLEFLASAYKHLDDFESFSETLVQLWQKDRSAERYIKAICRSCAKIGRLHSALEDRVDEILTMEIKDEELLDDLRNCYAHFNRIDLAIKIAQKGAEQNHVSSISFLARHYENSGELQLAAQYYLRLGEQGKLPGGACLFQSGNYIEAEKVFADLHGQEGTSQSILYHLGYCNVQLNKFDVALQYYEKLAVLNPSKSIHSDIVSLCKNLAKPLIEREDFEPALRYFEKAAQYVSELEEEQTEIKKMILHSIYKIVYLAVTEEPRNGTDVALLIDKAKGIDPVFDCNLAVLHGLFLLSQHEYEKALQIFAVSDKRFPGHSQIQFHKALIAFIDGKIDYAKTILLKLSEGGQEDEYNDRSSLLLALISTEQGAFEEAQRFIHQGTQRNLENAE